MTMVFQKLQQHDLKVKLNKCAFDTSSVEYLGHIISANGVIVDPTKIKVIRQWQHHKTVKGLRGFLGMVGYYHKFVKNFGMIAHPLTNMLKKDNFCWTIELVRAFQELKVAMTSTLVLVLPDLSKEFVVECDASSIGLTAVISQDNHSISFLSKTLVQKYQTLSVYDKK